MTTEHQETLLCCVGDAALVQIVQGGYRVLSLEVFKSSLNVILGTMVWMSMREQGLDKMGSDGPLQPQQSCDSISSEALFTLSHPVIL